jgi:hypothetical protein
MYPEMENDKIGELVEPVGNAGGERCPVDLDVRRSKNVSNIQRCGL